MIGDTSHDFAFALNAGVRCLGVAWGFHGPDRLRDAGAVAVVDTVAGLGAAIEQLS